MGLQAHRNLVRTQARRDLRFREPEDEAAMIAAARSGENSFFELLVKRYARRILLLALRITRNWHDAEDAEQRSFQKAYSQLHQFQGKSSFSTWMTRIAINEALLTLRNTYRWHEVSDPGARQFSRKDFQSAERCLAYVTGALDALPGKVEIVGGKQYEFAFRNQNVIVRDAVDSFNRYVSVHPESVNWSGVENLERALVNDRVAVWSDFSVTQSSVMPTKTANGQIAPPEPTR